MNTKRKQITDLTGNTFNRLTVVSYNGRTEGSHYMWNCQCICGKETIVCDSDLIRGKRKSCGCYKIIDLSGKRYGRLLVSTTYEKRNSKYYWLCECDCGEKVYKSGESLRKGNTKSCGCFLLESRFVDKTSDRTDTLLTPLYNKLLSRHAIKSDKTPITYLEYKDLVFSNCYYCGSEPLSVISDVRKEKKGRVYVTENIFKINGVDRVENLSGYTKCNSVTCCKHCNIAKHTLSQNDFFLLVKRIFENHIAWKI